MQQQVIKQEEEAVNQLTLNIFFDKTLIWNLQKI
jgi:hypothetical protein